MSKTFREDLDTAIEFHGHLCAGQILGTRIARIGLKHFGIDDPGTYRDLVVFVEADRCVADAMISVAGCHIGHRRLKWFDYGKMAATFYDIPSGKAIRICAINRSRPEQPLKGEELIDFYQAISDEDMFKIEEVEVDLRPEDLPGKPSRRVSCERCGEDVLDGRDVQVEGISLCKVCAGQPAYYTQVKG